MKIISSFRQFESHVPPNWEFTPTEIESETIKIAEHVLVDLKDTDSSYSIRIRNQYTLSASDNWYINTGVEKGFSDYFCIDISPNYTEIEEVVKIIKECISIITKTPQNESSKWKVNCKIDRGVTVRNIDIDEIVELSKLSDMHLGQIHLYFWRA
jgi:hypothetical protein